MRICKQYLEKVRPLRARILASLEFALVEGSLENLALLRSEWLEKEKHSRKELFSIKVSAVSSEFKQASFFPEL